MELAQQGAMSLLMAQDIAGGAFAYLKRTLDVAEVGHRDRILVRPPVADEAKFFALPDDGRVVYRLASTHRLSRRPRRASAVPGYLDGVPG
jgi:hypothetical protein